MRMRKKKHGAERLAACRDILLEGLNADESAPERMGMAGAPLWLEIGAGKGGFAREMARRTPTVAYVAMERVSDCVVLAAEAAKAEAGGAPKNLRFLVATADELTRLFAPESVSRLFLNFSDPWSKKGYAKRRLTHRRYLAVYFNLLKDGGQLFFKTDNAGLFDFSLEELEALGLTCDVVTRDLHASEHNADNVRTEYESYFAAQGVKINMLAVTKPRGFMPEIADELKRERKSFRE